MRKLYLHAGAGKTGTSVVQLFLAEHRDWLADQGFSYPEGADEPDPLTKIHSGNGGWLHGFMTTGLGWPEVRAQLRRAAGGTDVVISSEALAHVDPDGVARAKRLLADMGFELSPFYLVRNPDDHYLSAYQQHVKRHGMAKSFQEFCRNYPFEFELAIQRYEEALGRGGLRILSYEVGRSDIVAYVLRRGLGIDATPPEHGNPMVNRSLTRLEVEVLRTVNAAQHAIGASPEVIGRNGRRSSDLMIATRQSIPASSRFREPMPDDVIASLSPAIELVNDRLEDGQIEVSDQGTVEGLQEPEEEAAGILAAALLQIYELREANELLQQADERARAAHAGLSAVIPGLAGDVAYLRRANRAVQRAVGRFLGFQGTAAEGRSVPAPRSGRGALPRPRRAASLEALAAGDPAMRHAGPVGSVDP